jgi:hypothetical protein
LAATRIKARRCLSPAFEPKGVAAIGPPLPDQSDLWERRVLQLAGDFSVRAAGHGRGANATSTFPGLPP